MRTVSQSKGKWFDPWSGKIPHAQKQPSPSTTTAQPECLGPKLCSGRSHHDEKWGITQHGPCLLQRKQVCSSEGPAWPKINKEIKLPKQCPITLRLNKKGKQEKTCAEIAAAKRKGILMHCCCCSAAQSCPASCDPMAARQASLSLTNSRSSLRLPAIESVMPSNHLILCHPLLLPPSIFPSIRVFSKESALCIRWPKY